MDAAGRPGAGGKTGVWTRVPWRSSTGADYCLVRLRQKALVQTVTYVSGLYRYEFDAQCGFEPWILWESITAVFQP